MSSDFLINWDWSPESFTPPFTILYKHGLDYDGDEGEYRQSDDTCVSIMAVTHEQECNTGKAAGRWFVVTGYDVPKGQRQVFAQSMKALCELKYAQEKLNELR
jgi:hypothetical protein